MSLNIQPNGDRLIVKQIDIEQKTQGGLFIPTIDALKTFFLGQIVKAGDGKVLDNGTVIPCKYVEGDIIAYNPNNTFPITWNGVEYAVLRVNEVIFKVTD